MSQADTLELRPGYRISTMIRGCSPKDGPYRHMSSAAVLADMTAFADAGITTIDCDDDDPVTEHLVGAFLQDRKRAGGSAFTRSIQVHTKFAPDLAAIGQIDQTQVEEAIDQTLTRLGVEMLDLVQLHWPSEQTSGCLDVLGYLTLMQAKGKLRQIGVSDLDSEHLEMFTQAGIDIVSAQVPFSLIDQRPRDHYAAICRQHDIALLAHGTLAGGFLSQRWLGAPDPGFHLDLPSLIRHRRVIDAFGGWGLFQELLMALNAIAGRHGVTLASVALRAIHDHADVAAVILRSSDADQLLEHLKASNFTPTEQDRDTLNAVLAKRKGPHGPVFGLERSEAGHLGDQPLAKSSVTSGR